jgi:hypothetical protein
MQDECKMIVAAEDDPPTLRSFQKALGSLSVSLNYWGILDRRQISSQSSSGAIRL